MSKYETLDLNPSKEKEELLPISFVGKLKETLQENINPAEDPEQAILMLARIDMIKEHLRNTYEDWRTYQTFYILSGEPIPENVTKVDFPGDDSIIFLIENL